MARLIPSPPGGAPPNPFEQLVLDTYKQKLPRTYQLLPNFVLKQGNRNACEMDIVVLAPHAIYVVECKEWYGHLTGDDWEWLLNERHAFGRPMDLPDKKSKILKSFLGAVAQRVKVEPIYVLPDDTRISVTGGWQQNCLTLEKSLRFLQDPGKIGVSGANILPDHPTFVNRIQGNWGKRLQAARKKVGSYNLGELLHEDDNNGVTIKTYVAHHALITDNNQYRVRIWNLSPQLSQTEYQERLNIIRRPSEAIAQIGFHPGLLRVLQFDELPNEFGFYEVTEWSEFGTLHGYLKNTSRPQLTLRERLEIAAGVASALVAVHSKNVVHRNICPETILLGFDLQPRLTDFDRAYIQRGSAKTVFAQTKPRNPTYLPPELKDLDDYDFSYKSDMYCFGVLLYELLTGNSPFQSPQAAIDANGVPPSLPSDIRGSVPPEIDQLVLDLLRVDDFNARLTAQATLNILNQVLAGTTEVSLPDVEFTPAEPEPLSFADGSLLGNDYKIECRIGEGNFSTVYKVQHLEQGKYYAMKVLRDPAQAQVMFDEFGTGDRLPQHPNIAAIKWLARLPAPDNTPYILSEYVDGEKLKDYCDGTKILPLSEVKRVAIALLNALDAIHPKIDRINELNNKTRSDDDENELQELRRSGILHRDIKPDNILLDNRNNPKLIDFNIAAIAEYATGRGGTPRYWAPDRGQPEWEPSSDLFSLGVVLYELVTHRHPYANNTPGNGNPYDPLQIAPDSNISREFADFLLKTVQPTRTQRFQTAAKMRDALQQIPSLNAPPRLTPTPDQFANLTLEPDEVGKPDYNPYVTRLLTLYSQARRSNAGTRGLDEIARLTYVETKLDTALTPAILDGKFRLVIVTGNAGDGKTAFLQQLENQFETRKATLNRLPSGNGAEWTYENISYASNYDGSQDEGTIENDTVLANFLAPFKGKSLAGLSGNQARLIAINEGRLRDFLDHSPLRTAFEGLRREVQAFFLDGKEPPEGLLIVNLNLRAIASGGSKSLVERQLLALLKPEIWAPCEPCKFKSRCPLKANADTLRDPASGASVRSRLRRLFEVVHLRRQQHVTMRDLRSALSYLLLQDHSCDDIARILNSDDATEDLIRLSYTEAFAQVDETQMMNQPTVEDRLVRLLREVDVGLVDTPDLDRRLSANWQNAVPWLVFEQRSSYINDVFNALHQRTPDPTEVDDLVMVLQGQRRWLRSLRRRVYFERRDEGWRKMLPYSALEILEGVTLATLNGRTSDAKEQLKDCIVEAISLLEGVRHPQVRKQYICLRASQARNVSARSFRLFQKSLFELQVEDRSTMFPYLEVAPDTVTLRANDPDIGQATLRLSLDLLEMLEMVRHGYRPNPNDMGGLFVNLVIFRNTLLHLPYTSVLVTKDDERFYQISADLSGGQVALHIEERQDVDRLGEAQ